MHEIARVFHGNPRRVLFGAAATLRILLAVVFPALPDLLTARVEISSPVNSFKRLQEGLFLYDRGLDPYDGGIFHQAPLLLPLFSLLPSPSTWFGRLASILLYTALDLFCANCLLEIAKSGAASISTKFVSPRRGRAWKPISIAAVYLFNPYTLLTSLGRPTTVFTTFFTLLSINHACQGNMITTAFALAFASFMSLHPILLLPPVILLCYDQFCQRNVEEAKRGEKGEREQNTKANASEGAPKLGKVAIDQRSLPPFVPFVLILTMVFGSVLAMLFGLSRLFLPSWNFVGSVFMTPLTLPDLTPNPGLWWYFFIEMFDAFREFFLGVFWLHMLSYSVPFALRFRKQPLAAVVLMLGITAIFQPYANIGDVGAWLGCICLLGHVFELSSTHRYTFPALAALLYATLLGPAFHHLWIYAGSGNANFFYAITLVWNLALLILLTDTIYAVLRDEWEAERPEGKGQEVRQI